MAELKMDNGKLIMTPNATRETGTTIAVPSTAVVLGVPLPFQQHGVRLNVVLCVHLAGTPGIEKAEQGVARL